MAVRTDRITVGTSASQLTPSTLTDQQLGASSILIKAPAAAVLYVGGQGVTTATGYDIPAGGELALDLNMGERIYGVVSTGTGTVAVLMSGA